MRPVRRAPPGQLHHLADRPAPTVIPLSDDRAHHRYAQAALTQELARVTAAPQGRRNQQLREATRNLCNLVATDALDDHQVHQGSLQAVDRSGLLRDEPRQTQRTLTSSRQIAWPPTQHPIAPAPTPPMLRHLHQPEPKASGPRIGASLKVATAKVERATERGSGDGAQARERAAERSGDFNDAAPF
jgi:hypothetical protein